MPNRFSEIRCRCMILSIHRGRTHQHQQIVIKYWQRAINSPPIETVGAGNFLPESSPFAGRFLCKPVRCWASHRRAPAATTRRVPQIRTAPADTHERCSGLREWTGPIDLEQAFTEWIQWDDTQYRLQHWGVGSQVRSNSNISASGLRSWLCDKWGNYR